MPTRKKTTILGAGTAIWVVEVSLFSAVPKVTKYWLVEMRETGVKVLVRGMPRFIGPAAGRHWFTDRAKAEQYVRRELTRNISIFLRLARESTDALAALPAMDVTLVPPAERDKNDRRPEF